MHLGLVQFCILAFSYMTFLSIGKFGLLFLSACFLWVFLGFFLFVGFVSCYLVNFSLYLKTHTKKRCFFSYTEIFDPLLPPSGEKKILQFEDNQKTKKSRYRFAPNKNCTVKHRVPLLFIEQKQNPLKSFKSHNYCF